MSAETIKASDLPAELWMLWNQDTEGWLLSIDGCPEGETYLVAFSEDEAKVAAEHQNNSYNLNCVPVRVYPREDS